MERASLRAMPSAWPWGQPVLPPALQAADPQRRQFAGWWSRFKSRQHSVTPAPLSTLSALGSGHHLVKLPPDLAARETLPFDSPGLLTRNLVWQRFESTSGRRSHQPFIIRFENRFQRGPAEGNRSAFESARCPATVDFACFQVDNQDSCRFWHQHTV